MYTSVDYYLHLYLYPHRSRYIHQSTYTRVHKQPQQPLTEAHVLKSHRLPSPRTPVLPSPAPSPNRQDDTRTCYDLRSDLILFDLRAPNPFQTSLRRLSFFSGLMLDESVSGGACIVPLYDLVGDLDLV